jgi:hypothetical protein
MELAGFAQNSSLKAHRYLRGEKSAGTIYSDLTEMVNGPPAFSSDAFLIACHSGLAPKALKEAKPYKLVVHTSGRLHPIGPEPQNWR